MALLINITLTPVFLSNQKLHVRANNFRIRFGGNNIHVLICGHFFEMTRAKTYNNYHYGSAIFMIMALLWLSVSAPFVLGNHDKDADSSKCCSTHSPFAGAGDENNNPAGNTTEEKTPKSINNFSEEYLHDDHRSDHLSVINLQYCKNQDAGIYLAYHGEPLVPPPNVA